MLRIASVNSSRERVWATISRILGITFRPTRVTRRVKPANLAKAQAIAPESAEVLAAAGYLDQWRGSNYERALGNFEKSLAVNPSNGQVMLELGVGAEVCWPRRGQEKGAVENLETVLVALNHRQRWSADDWIACR